MNRRKWIIWLNIILVVVYFIIAGMLVDKYSSFSNDYRQHEELYIHSVEVEIQNIIDELPNIDENKISRIREQYPLELIMDRNGEIAYRSLPLQVENTYVGLIDPKALLFETQGTKQVGTDSYLIYLAIYPLGDSSYLESFITQQNILISMAFLVITTSLGVVQYLLIKPILKISNSIEKANNYEFDAIDEKNSDSLNKDFSGFVQRLRQTMSEVSREHTELEAKLQYEKERLNNVFVVSKGLIHDLKSPVHKLLLDNEIEVGKNQTNRALKRLAGVNVKDTESILEDLNGILKMMNYSYSNYSEEELINIVDLVANIQNSLAYLQKNNNIGFWIDAPERAIVKGNIINMKLLIHNMISNAFKYAAKDSEVEFFIDTDPKTLTLKITNESSREDADRMLKTEGLFNAVSENKGTESNGLFLIKDLVDLMNGNYTLNVEDNHVDLTVILPVVDKEV